MNDRSHDTRFWARRRSAISSFCAAKPSSLGIVRSFSAITK